MTDKSDLGEERIIALLREEACRKSPIDVVKSLKATIGARLSQFEATRYLWMAFPDVPKIDLNMAAASRHVVGASGVNDEDINAALKPWFDARRNSAV